MAQPEIKHGFLAVGFEFLIYQERIPIPVPQNFLGIRIGTFQMIKCVFFSFPNFNRVTKITRGTEIMKTKPHFGMETEKSNMRNLYQQIENAIQHLNKIIDRKYSVEQCDSGFTLS